MRSVDGNRWALRRRQTLWRRLIELKIVERSATCLPQLTPCGEKCFVVLDGAMMWYLS